MKNRVALLLLLAIFSSSVLAFVIGGSNLGILGYSDHTCRKPIKPIKPYSFNTRQEVDSYNNQVESYNMEYQHYVSCIKEYLENANNDIKRIEEKMDDAITEVKKTSY